jgi:hypothetical protein
LERSFDCSLDLFNALKLEAAGLPGSNVMRHSVAYVS